MKTRCTALSKAALAGFLALAFLVVGGASKATAAVINCKSGIGPNSTIVIYNDSPGFNIYPVLFAGAPSATDQWMQGCFKVPFNQIGNNPYPRDSQYRMYVNCCRSGQNGIPPGGSVTITLPFYSPLVASINPKGAKQFIDWWQGGGINVYQTAGTTKTPPPWLQSHWNADVQQGAVSPNSNPPACSGLPLNKNTCALHFFRSTSIANWEPQQLIEYTLGAAGEDAQRKTVDQPKYLWVPDNVDYDVSNVNYAYMPAAIEPFGNSLQKTCCAIGWVGSTSRIADVFTAMTNWRNASIGKDWPLYVDQNSTTKPKATIPLKVPSALELFLNFNAFDNTNNYIPAPSKSPPIIRMTALWKDCQMGAVYTICPRINDVTKLLQANYNNYLDVYANNQDKWINEWKCTQKPSGGPLPDKILLAHFYGWGPFNEFCDAKANLLEKTPGYVDLNKTPNYAAVKAEYDQVQYWYNVLAGNYGQWNDAAKPDYGQFDPYVALVHGKSYMNAPYTYAYSVDDAVGNMQTDGTGLIIAVGGPENLPNPAHVTREVLFTFGYKSDYAGGINFTKYGRCTTAPDTDTVSYFTTFVVPEGIAGTSNSVLNCKITMKDSKNRLYTFTLKGLPTDFPKPIASQKNWPDAQQITAINNQFINCSGNSGQVLNSWCKLIFTYQTIDKTNPHLPPLYYVIMGGPPPLQ